MANVDYKMNCTDLVLELSGRIDSTNALQVEEAVKSACDSNNHENVIVDLENLEYISSAGLRIVLRLRKDNPELKLINASTEVYEILDMTGFTEMMTVEKAYRRVSVEGCEIIGRGANGMVYRLDPDTIIKVYINPDSLPDIHRERELARKAFVLGIPTAIPYDVVKVGDGYGSVFELLNAKSFSKLINADPENLDKYVEIYVDLLKKIHSTEVKEDDMPDMKQVAVGWAEFYKDYLPADKAEKLVSLVKDVPKTLYMMHGDYHLKNVMMQNGEVLLIDMDTLCYGHPIFELASMYNAYEGFSALDPSKSGAFLGISAEFCVKVWEKSLELYLGESNKEKFEEVEKKAKLLGFTRLARRLIRRGGLDRPEDKKLVDYYISNITELLDEINTLVF